MSDHLENRFMFPITCDICRERMGYAWDAEYDRPQDVHRCIKCYESQEKIEQLKSYRANYEHATKLDEELVGREDALPSCQPLPDKATKRCINWPCQMPEGHEGPCSTKDAQ